MLLIVLKSLGLQTHIHFNVDYHNALSYRYNGADKNLFTDDLLFALWLKLFFDTTHSPCYLCNGDVTFTYNMMGSINHMLSQNGCNYRLIYVNSNLVKAYIA